MTETERPYHSIEGSDNTSPYAEAFTKYHLKRLRLMGLKPVPLTGESIQSFNERALGEGGVPSIGKRNLDAFEQAMFEEPNNAGEVAIRVSGVDPGTEDLTIAEMIARIDPDSLPRNLVAKLPTPGEAAQLFHALAKRHLIGPFAGSFVLTSAVDPDGKHVFVGNPREGRGVTIVRRDEEGVQKDRDAGKRFATMTVLRPVKGEQKLADPVWEREAPFRFQRSPEMSQSKFTAGLLMQLALDGEDPLTSAQLAETFYGNHSIDDRRNAGSELTRQRRIFAKHGLHLKGYHIPGAKRALIVTELFHSLLPSATINGTVETCDKILRDPGYLALGFVVTNYDALSQSGLVLPDLAKLEETIDASSSNSEAFSQMTSPLSPTQRSVVTESARQTAVGLARVASHYHEHFNLAPPQQPGMNLLFQMATNPDEYGGEENVAKVLYVIEHNGVQPISKLDGDGLHVVGKVVTHARGVNIFVNGNGNGNSVH